MSAGVESDAVPFCQCYDGGLLHHGLRQRIATLQRLLLFRKCSDSLMYRIAKKLRRRCLAIGEVLTRAGYSCSSVYLLEEGHVQLWGEEEEESSGLDGPGGIVGDPRVLLDPQDKLWQHNCIARSFCYLLELRCSDVADTALKIQSNASKRRVSEILAVEMQRDFSKEVAIFKAEKSLATEAPDSYTTSGLKRVASRALRLVQFVKATTNMEPSQAANARGGPPLPSMNALRQMRESATKKQKAKDGSGTEEGKQEEDKKSREAVVFNSEAQKQEIAASLQALDFFSTLDTFSFERLASLFRKKFWRRNEQLLVEGTPAKELHVVAQGDVSIILGGKVLNKVGPKSILGERSVLNSGSGDAAPCGATVTAASAVVVTISASRIHLLDLFTKDPALLDHFQSRFDIERDRRGVTSFRNVKLFREADPSFTQALEVEVKERIFYPSEYLLTQGQECREAVLLCKGSVNIVANGVQVGLIEVKEMPDALLFGEFTLLGLWPFPRASIVAKTNCLVQIIDASALSRCLDKYPEESFIFRELIEARLNKIYEQEEVARQIAEKEAAEAAGGHEARVLRSPSRHKKRTIPRGIAEVKGFNFSSKCIKELESYLHKRLFIPQQIITHQGTDLQDVYILQQGSCEALIFGVVFETFTGSCVIGGLPSVLTKKVFTTVVAKSTCFVVKISQRHFTAVFEKHQDDRKKLFAAAQRAFSKMCDEFQQNTWIAKSLEKQLAVMPCLHGSSSGFIVSLAKAVEPRLLIAGQEIFLSSNKEEGADLYFVFEGHFHCLQKGAVVGTISPGMLFGILEVFGISDLSEDMRIRSDEICKVGVLTRAKLCDLLRDFPEERGKFEELVHNLMEDSVNHHLVALPFFSRLNNQQILTICHLLDRRFLLPDVTVVREGDGGDFMVVLNCGKAEIIFKSMTIGTLSPGKAFGAPQMMNIHSRYHATLKTKSTCHILLIYWHMMSGLIISAADLAWVEAMKQQAKKIHEKEVNNFSAKLQRLSKTNRSTQILVENMDFASSPWTLKEIFQEWHVMACEGRVHRSSMMSRPLGSHSKTKTRNLGIVGKDDSFKVTTGTWTEAAVPKMVLKPLRFRRDMNWMDLKGGRQSRSASKAQHRLGNPRRCRLDIWKGLEDPEWLQEVRGDLREVAKQRFGGQSSFNEVDHWRE